LISAQSDVVGFVEIDGIALMFRRGGVSSSSLPTRREALAEIVSALREGSRPVDYYSAAGRFRLHLALAEDVVASMPDLPPSVGRVLDQAAVDAVLALGDTPESAAACGKLRLHAELSEAALELERLMALEGASHEVSRVLPLEQVRPNLDERVPAIDRFRFLADVLRGSESPILRPTAEEQKEVAKILKDLHRDVGRQFERTVEGINEDLSASYSARYADLRNTVDPRYRQALDRMATTFRKSGGIGRLFVRPILSFGPNGGLTVIVRPVALAHLVRFGGYHAPFDVEASVPEALELLRLRNDRPLWLRLVVPDGISSWHRLCLRRVHREALAAMAAEGAGGAEAGAPRGPEAGLGAA
jgi:hypothetical protein